MKVEASKFRNAAKAALDMAKSVALVPIMEYILVGPCSKGMFIFATNHSGDVYIETEAIEAPKKGLCLHGPSIAQIINTIDGVIDISLKSTGIATIKAAGLSLEFPCLPGSEYPKGGVLPSLSDGVSIDFSLLTKDLPKFDLLLETDSDVPWRGSAFVGPDGTLTASYSASVIFKAMKSEIPVAIPAGVKSKVTPLISDSNPWMAINTLDSFYMAREGAHIRRATKPVKATEVYYQFMGKLKALKALDVSGEFIADEAFYIAIARAVAQKADKVMITGNGSQIVLSSSSPTGGELRQTVDQPCGEWEVSMAPKILHDVLSLTSGPKAKLVAQPAHLQATFYPNLWIVNEEIDALVAPMSKQ